MEHLSRRSFFSLSAVATLGLMLPNLDDNSHKVIKTIPEQNIFDIFGLHDSPPPGGSPNIEKAFADLKRFGARKLFSLDPSDKLLERATLEGVQVIARGVLSSRKLKDNRYNKGSLLPTIERMKRYIARPLIQPYNEVNLLEETAGKPRFPEDHIENDLIPAAELISEYGATTLITPLAQRAYLEGTDIDEIDYFKRMLVSLKAIKGPNWVKQNLALSLHEYFLTPLTPQLYSEPEDLWNRIIFLDSLVWNILGLKLPIYVTEGGPGEAFMKLHGENAEAEAAKTTINILKEPIPEILQPPFSHENRLKCFCFWLYANEAQRDFERDKYPDSFELTAWVKAEGYSKTARYVEEYAGSKIDSHG